MNPPGELQLLFYLKKTPAPDWQLLIKPRIPKHPHLSEEHSSFLSQMALALNVSGVYPYNKSWGVKKETAQAVWNVLSRHKDHHVNLFFEKNFSRTEEIHTHALSMKINISDHERGVRLGAQLYLGETPLKDRTVIMIGDPAVFGVLAASPDAQSADSDTLKIISIHPVKHIRAKTFLGLLSKPMDIPMREIPSFISRWAEELVRDFHVDNQSAVVTLPDRRPLKAIFSIQNTGDGHLKTSLGWSHPHRSLSEEMTIQQELEKIVYTFSPLWHSLNQHGTRQLKTESLLAGIDAVDFVTRFLPLLEIHPDVVVKKDLLINHWALDPATPRAEFFVDDNAEKTDWFDLQVEISVGRQKVAMEKILPTLAAKEKYFFLPDGKYFLLDTPFFDKLRDLMHQAKSLMDVRSSVFKLTRFQTGWWDELQKLGVVKRQSIRWQSAIQGLSRSSSPKLLAQPKNFIGTLRDYQAYGYSWMSFLRRAGLGGVLADDMGLGKTIQTLAFIANACKADKNLTRNKPFLIIAPTSVVENWSSEIERFAPSLKTIVFRRGERTASLDQMTHSQVVITSYSLLGRDEPHFSKVHWDTIIVDEAQFVKNHRSKAYALLRRLHADSKIALTGTPMENNLMELWSVFSVGAPGLFPSAEKFKTLFQKPIEKEGHTEILPLLRSYLKPFLLRRTKDRVEKELPPKIEQTLHLPMDPKQRHVYDVYLLRERQRVLGLLREGGLKKNRFEILTSLTRLRQLCLHASLVDEKNNLIPSAKLEALTEHLHTILEENHKVLVFSQFTSFLSIVQKRLKKENIRFAYLDGSTRDRKKVLNEFTEDKNIPVFLISLKAGGFGLNLTCADYCILLDPWWNPAVENQAIDRTHRIGQKNHVMVYRFIIRDSIEEKVLKLQDKKRVLFKNVLEDGEIFSSMVTEEDIQNIFNLPKTF